MRCQQRIVRKCRSRLHWIARKGLLLSVDLDRSWNLRSRTLTLTVTFKPPTLPIDAKETGHNFHLQPILSVRRWKMVLWGSFRPFLSSLPPLHEELESHFLWVFFLFSLCRRIWSPFSSTNFLVLLAQVSSVPILFGENRYMKKILGRIFFSWTWKTKRGDFEERKLLISAKMRKNGSTGA